MTDYDRITEAELLELTGDLDPESADGNWTDADSGAVDLGSEQ